MLLAHLIGSLPLSTISPCIGAVAVLLVVQEIAHVLVTFSTQELALSISHVLAPLAHISFSIWLS